MVDASWASMSARSRGDSRWKDETASRLPPPGNVSAGLPVDTSAQSKEMFCVSPGLDQAALGVAVRVSAACTLPGSTVRKPTEMSPAAAAGSLSSPSVPSGRSTCSRSSPSGSATVPTRCSSASAPSGVVSVAVTPRMPMPAFRPAGAVGSSDVTSTARNGTAVVAPCGTQTRGRWRTAACRPAP